jgi:hypothetical protein
MAPDDLKALANDILRADSQAEMYRLLSPLTTDETEEVVQLVEMGAMKARVRWERAKGRPRSTPERGGADFFALIALS